MLVLYILVGCYLFFRLNLLNTEAATRGVLCSRLFLEISQNSQESTCARVSFLITLQAWGLQLY